MLLPFKFSQIRLPFETQILVPLQTPPRNLDVHVDILNQALLAHIIVFGPYKPQDKQIHMGVVEILFKRVEDMDFLSSIELDLFVHRGGIMMRIEMV